MSSIFAVAGVVIRELYRRKDFYVLFVLTGVIGLTMAWGNFMKDDKTPDYVREGYLKEICLLIIWVASLAIAIATAARQLPTERENRTLFPLLAKPVNRAQVVAGTFLGCWIASGLALLVLYFIVMIVSFSQEHQAYLLEYAAALWMQWVFLAVVISLVIWGSVGLASPAANGTACLILIAAVFVLQRHLNDIAVEKSEPWRSLLYILYFVLPRPEWFDLREALISHHGWPGALEFAAVTVYGGAYAGLFLLAAWLGFRRRPLTA